MEDLVQGAAADAAHPNGHPGSEFASMPQVLQQDADAWALRINASWRRSFESTIEAGQLLIDAKRQLPHGQFEKMIEIKLDFSASTAQRLMIVARDLRITNPAHGQLLPRSARTLYELSKLTDEQFTYGVEQKIITPDMERKDVELIRPTPARHPQESQAKEPEADVTDLRCGDGAEGSSRHVAGRTATGETAPDSTPLPYGARAVMASRIEPTDSLDFLPTPPWATRALLVRVLAYLERLGHCKFQTVWEPACGEGHMAEVLKEYFREVRATDIHDYGYGEASDLDFLDEKTVWRPDWIITNPPFEDLAEKFTLKALELAGVGVAMFVPLRWLETIGRYERLFRDRPPTLISFFVERVNLCKGRWDPDGSTATAYIWLVWIKGAEPRAPFWIPPGCREALTKPEDIKRFGKSIVGEAA